MQIHVADIPGEGTVLESRIPPHHFAELKQLEADGECRFLSDISAHLKIRKVSDMIQVKGKLEMNTGATCGRCLADYEAPVVHRFSIDFIPESSAPIPDEDEIALRAEDMGFIHYKGEVIDFHDAIQEQVILSLPVRPLCREDCKGLCQTCGGNLNEGPCGCSGTGSVDPRFAVLKNLKLSVPKKADE